MNILLDENKCNILFGLQHSEKGGTKERPINLKELIIYTEKIYFVCCDLFYWYTAVQFRLRSRKIIVSQQRSIINKYSREFFLYLCQTSTNTQNKRKNVFLKFLKFRLLKWHLATLSTKNVVVELIRSGPLSQAQLEG